MSTTAKIHFDSDIQRSFELLEKARQMEMAGDTGQLMKDIRGAALAFSVGAMDAYLCDKYVNCLSAALQAYSDESWRGAFPSAYAKQTLPIGEILDRTRAHRPNWGITMAVRSIMEKDNMYSLTRLEGAFNGILPDSQKLWQSIVPQLAALERKRFTLHVTSDLAGLSGKPLHDKQKEVVSNVKRRIGASVQFRHDWIHNCSRPKGAITTWTYGESRAAMNEVKSFVEIFDAHIEAYRLA